MTEESKELVEFRQEVAAWLKENIPADPGIILPQSFMEVGSDDQFNFLRDWQKKVYEAGYLGMAWPKEYGGGGHPQVMQDIATEEMIRAKAPFMLNAIGLSWAGPTILKLGSVEQKEAYIQKILNAEEIWCQGFSEPENGSDLGNAQVRADRDGDDFVINGSKIWTSLGMQASRMILLARSIQDAPNKYMGLSFFLSPMDVEGVEVVPIKKITGEIGFNETRFTDARIPANCLVGQEGQGWMVALAVLAFERGADSGQGGGSLMNFMDLGDVIEMARDCSRDGKPALEDPLIRDQLVQYAIEQRSLELTMQRGRIKHLLTRERPMATQMMSKLCGSEYMRRLAAFAVQVQGTDGNLYIGDPNASLGGLWQRAQMNAYSATIGGGTSEVQHNIIGERILGLAKG